MKIQLKDGATVDITEQQLKETITTALDKDIHTLTNYLLGTCGTYDRELFKLDKDYPLPVFELLGKDFFNPLRENDSHNVKLVGIFHKSFGDIAYEIDAPLEEQ